MVNFSALKQTKPFQQHYGFKHFPCATWRDEYDFPCTTWRDEYGFPCTTWRLSMVSHVQHEEMNMVSSNITGFPVYNMKRWMWFHPKLCDSKLKAVLMEVCCLWCVGTASGPAARHSHVHHFYENMQWCVLLMCIISMRICSGVSHSCASFPWEYAVVHPSHVHHFHENMQWCVPLMFIISSRICSGAFLSCASFPWEYAVVRPSHVHHFL